MASNCTLTEGALQIIMQGGNVTDPIMQVLGSKKMNTLNPNSDRYRILLSDGKFSISNAMLTTTTNDKFGSNGLQKFSVIKLTKYLTTVANNTGKTESRVLLIMDGEKVVDGNIINDKIGSPTPLNLTDIQNASTSSHTNGTSSQTNGTSSYTNGTSGNANASNSNYGTSRSSGVPMENGVSSLHSQVVHPISSLSPYQNRWVIKARVSNKSAIRTWSNSRGEGKLFSFDLIDESGEIRCTCFRDSVDKFYDKIEIDKVYYISKCQLKPANRQFSTLKNEYEMTVTAETIIEECLDGESSSIPQTKYDFVPIDRIAQMEVGTMLDIIAVAKQTSDVATFQAKTTGRELKKREVTLVDPSKASISLTLWGAEAENFNGENNPVVVIKSAKIGEFGGGKNLSTVASSHVKINPLFDESYRMRAWYDGEGKHMETVNMSATSGLGGNFQTPWMTIKQVQEQNLGRSEKGDYYQLMATVLLVKGENCIYKACPTENCNKKIVDLQNGMYRCEKCNREFPDFKFRLLVNMNVADWSGNQWISMFHSEAEKILGMTGEEVGRQADDNPTALNEITDKAHFKQYIIKCRAKMETYNDEARLKTVAVRVDPINYEEYNSHLIQNINDLLSMANNGI